MANHCCLAAASTPAIRVLHVITRLVRGGAQENTLATAARLNGNGWISELATGYARGSEGDLEAEALAAGIRLHRVPALVREVSPLWDARALAQLLRLIRRGGYHIVHTHTSKAGILGRVAARLAGVPVVVHTPHGHVFQGYYGPALTAAFRAVERLCAPLAQRLVALTEQERREHLDYRIGRAERWVTVHSGVDFAPLEAAAGQGPMVRGELGLPPDAPVIGCVARLVPIKGHAVLLQAFAGVAQAEPRALLLLVGDGPLRADLETQAERLGICSRVRFLGLRTDVPRLLAALDLFVLPSLNEGMGRALVEAMAMRLPVVASRVSGIPDVVREGETGLLVPPGAPRALAEAILALLRDPARRQAMGEAGRARVVPAFGLEAMVARLEALYRELLAERAREGPAEGPLWPRH